jgi:glyoxylase-like metal-dependent hydrolase (beta-lactamase superfamily II)
LHGFGSQFGMPRFLADYDIGANLPAANIEAFMTTPDVTAFFDPATNTVSYLVVDPVTSRAAVIDSVLDFDVAAGRFETNSAKKILSAAAAARQRVVWVLETHVHADHISAAPFIASHTGARVGISERVREVQKEFIPTFGTDSEHPDGKAFDQLFADEEVFTIGTLQARVLHTPGHTPACAAYVIGDAVFVGDTLFMPDFGTARADFPGGDARTLYRSIRRILDLPPETRLFVGHDYKAPGRQEFAWETTVGAERAQNVHIREGITEQAFVRLREARDATLSPPKLLYPSIQMNMRAGHLPPPDANGQRYLRIPIEPIHH